MGVKRERERKRKRKKESESESISLGLGLGVKFYPHTYNLRVCKKIRHSHTE